MSENIVEKLKPILKNIVEDNGLFLFDIEFLKEDGVYFLRVSIEKEDKTMDFMTCEKIADIISKKLDELDPIPHEYILETCSPGLERPIRNKEEYIEYLNEYISVYLEEKVDNLDIITGYLREVEEDGIVLEYKNKTRTKNIKVKNENIIKAHLAVKF